MRRFEVTWLNATVACTVQAQDETAAAVQGADVIAQQYGMTRPPVPGSSVQYKYVALYGPVSGELVAVVVPAPVPDGLY